MELHIIPCISTTHITQEIATQLTNKGNDNPWCQCASWEYGFFLYLGGPAKHRTPQALLDIKRWLAMQAEDLAGTVQGEFGWIRLDRDGPVVDGLPTYDW